MALKTGIHLMILIAFYKICESFLMMNYHKSFFECH